MSKDRIGLSVIPLHRDKRSASPVSSSQDSIYDTPSCRRTPDLGSTSDARGQPSRSRFKDENGYDVTFLKSERRKLPLSKVLAKAATSDDQRLMSKLEAVETEFNKKLQEIKQEMSRTGKGKEPFIAHEPYKEEMDIGP